MKEELEDWIGAIIFGLFILVGWLIPIGLIVSLALVLKSFIRIN